MFFKKKSYVRFTNLVPGVEKVHPIVPASKFKFDWIKNLNRSNLEINKTRSSFEQKGNTAKCPGIFDIMTKGYIVTAPFDFTIITNGDRINFEWRININPTTFNPNINRPYIAAHSPDQLHDFTPERDDSLRSVVKINTYWHIFSSKDIVFLQMPIPYPEHNIFSCYHGIIDTNKYCDLVLQLQWHKLEGEHLVRAGTPLCQLIPIQKNIELDCIIDQLSEEDLYTSNSYGYLTMHRFVKDMNEWKEKAKEILKPK